MKEQIEWGRQVILRRLKDMAERDLGSGAPFSYPNQLLLTEMNYPHHLPKDSYFSFTFLCPLNLLKLKMEDILGTDVR